MPFSHDYVLHKLILSYKHNNFNQCAFVHVGPKNINMGCPNLAQIQINLSLLALGVYIYIYI